MQLLLTVQLTPKQPTTILIFLVEKDGSLGNSSEGSRSYPSFYFFIFQNILI